MHHALYVTCDFSFMSQWGDKNLELITNKGWERLHYYVF